MQSCKMQMSWLQSVRTHIFVPTGDKKLGAQMAHQGEEGPLGTTSTLLVANCVGSYERNKDERKG